MKLLPEIVKVADTVKGFLIKQPTDLDAKETEKYMEDTYTDRI